MNVEVVHVVNGTTRADVFACSNVSVTMAGARSSRGTVIELVDGVDVDGRPVRSALYRNAERVIVRYK